MVHLLQKAIILTLWLLLLVSCQSTPQDEGTLRGRVTLWHSWPPVQAVVLENALAEFQEIHPEVKVITVALPEEQLLNEFIKAGANGLGPGLLIGRDEWIRDLADTGLIRPVSSEDIIPELRDSPVRSLTEYEGQFYGVPFSLAPRALYYNKSMITEPPATLEAMLQQADAGNRVAFVPRFEEAYWGIQAFGQGLFDDEGRFTLADSGFEQWLGWLNAAQHAPGVILNIDDDSLLELFASQQIAYYVAGPEKQGRITEIIGEGFEFGVSPLPSGPYGSSGPLLSAETILLYAYASPDQSRSAHALAAFLINQQQSIRFMRDLGRVPANPAVQVDRRIYPIVNGFSQQAKTAVVIPNEIPRNLLVYAGNRAYVSVLSGGLSPEEAMCRFGQDIAAFEDYSAAEIMLPPGCTFPGKNLTSGAKIGE